MESPTLSQRISSFGKFIYNGETGEVLGRGGRSWAEIGLFYVIYYTCLAGFFAATLAVFNTTLDENFPKLQGSSSLLKGNPGMGFQPLPDIDSTLVFANKEKKDDYVKSIAKVLKEYKEATDEKRVDCDLGQLRPDANDACIFNYSALTAECNEDNMFGVKEEKPCVLLKLNRIYGWSPELWTEEEVQDAENVADYIKAQYTPDRIWVDCHGENDADNDNIKSVSYYPEQGFPLGYYPYRKQEEYLAPLVFVKFDQVKRHMALMVECKALAKNIAVDRTEKEGSVHFELLVDP